MFRIIKNSKVYRELEKYIELYYKPDEKYIFISPNADAQEITKNSGKQFEQQKQDLAVLVEEAGETFCEMLFRIIKEKGVKESEVYKNACIDRKLFSKIRSNPMYHPRKQTVLALAIALKLNIEETVDLLTSAEYALSPGSKGDLIVKYFIEHEIFDIMAINFALDEYKQPVLR